MFSCRLFLVHARPSDAAPNSGHTQAGLRWSYPLASRGKYWRNCAISLARPRAGSNFSFKVDGPTRQSWTPRLNYRNGPCLHPRGGEQNPPNPHATSAPHTHDRCQTKYYKGFTASHFRFLFSRFPSLCEPKVVKIFLSSESLGWASRGALRRGLG